MAIALICVLITIISAIIGSILDNYDILNDPTLDSSEKNINTKKTKISVEQIQQMYRIAPNKWTFDEKFCTYYPTDSIDPVVFRFTTYKSLRNYRRWLKQKNREKEEIKENETMARVLKEWASDIQEYRKKNDMQIAEALKENERIRENIEKGLDIQDTLWYNKDTEKWEIHKRGVKK